jgi:hypothetical protein
MSKPSMWILGGIFAIVLAICIAGAVLAIAANDPEVEVNLGDDEFEIQNLGARAESVARGGALRFPDPTGGSRPIIVNHLGGEPDEGWVAVLAIAPGTDGCIVDWDDDDERFRDCEARSYPPDGEGLDHFPTRVEDDSLFIDLGRGRSGDDGDDAPTDDSIVITGTD